jgi:hypothetical protein
VWFGFIFKTQSLLNMTDFVVWVYLKLCENILQCFHVTKFVLWVFLFKSGHRVCKELLKLLLTDTADRFLRKA